MLHNIHHELNMTAGNAQVSVTFSAPKKLVSLCNRSMPRKGHHNGCWSRNTSMPIVSNIWYIEFFWAAANTASGSSLDTHMITPGSAEATCTNRRMLFLLLIAARAVVSCSFKKISRRQASKRNYWGWNDWQAGHVMITLPLVGLSEKELAFLWRDFR